MMIVVLQKHPFSGLHPLCVSWYSFLAVAKSTAGRENSIKQKATYDALSVFFYVVAIAHQFITAQIRTESMVALVGLPSGRPGSFCSGILTPANVTANQSVRTPAVTPYKQKEIIIMMATPPPVYPQFIFVFAAVRRTERKPRICMLRTVAGDERSARLSLVRDYVLTFAGRLPVAEVYA